jgi:hypothetical protein
MVRGWVFGSLLLTTALMAPARSAHAQAAAPTASAPAHATPALLAERARLQAALNGVNAEVDALKARPRGLGDDYRLRSRMADAQDLARRLTELDARLGTQARPAPRPDDGSWPAPPRIDPSDDRSELDAKADILTDQARRLTGEANRLETRAADLRARRQLRRRAGQLEDDPFSPLEQAKGRVAVSSNRNANSGGGVSTVDSKSPSPPSRGTTDTAGGSAPTGSFAPGTTTGTSAEVSAPALTTSPSAQLRGALDPASLAEIRKLDGASASPATLAALERAVVALRQRAALLEANARQLRQRGTPPRR